MKKLMIIGLSILSIGTGAIQAGTDEEGAKELPVHISKEEAAQIIGCLPDKYKQSIFMDAIAGKTQDIRYISGVARAALISKDAAHDVPQVPFILDWHHTRLTRCLLQNHPNAIKELERRGLIYQLDK